MTTQLKQKRRKVTLFPIMIIEDNADQWLIMRAALMQCFPEVELIWINNVFQAKIYLESHSTNETKLPRLILSDLYLPCREDGWALLDFVRTHTFERKPPVVIISASPEEDDITKVYSLGGASYIVKPRTYHEWVTSLYAFRRYWWELVRLPLSTR